MVTGPAHWELLQRARAVDNQVFVLTCSPARDTSNSGGYVAWGHRFVFIYIINNIIDSTIVQ